MVKPVPVFGLNVFIPIGKKCDVEVGTEVILVDVLGKIAFEVIGNDDGDKAGGKIGVGSWDVLANEALEIRAEA